jgi:hypothetical protein
MRTYSGDFMASRYGLVAMCGITRGVYALSEYEREFGLVKEIKYFKHIA